MVIMKLMVEREVPDIMIASVATIMLFVFVQVPMASVMRSILIIVNILLLLINFLHIILHQLYRISEQQSVYVIYLNLVLVLISFTCFLLLNPSPVTGFWNRLGSGGFQIFIYGCYLILGFFIYLGKDADLNIEHYTE